MRALTLVADRKLELIDVPAPPPPGPDEVQVRVKAVGLNHLILGLSGHGFRQAQAAARRRRGGVGDVAAVGERRRRVRARPPGRRCTARRPAAPVRPAARAATISAKTSPASWAFISTASRASFSTCRPGSSSRRRTAFRLRDAACAPIAFGTVQHMLFDNAKLEPGETILVHAGGSGIGTAAIKMAKAIGCTVITTVGDDEKGAKGESARRRSRHQLPHRAF